MTRDLSDAVDRLVPDDPFLLDWQDVQSRSEQMRRDVSAPQTQPRLSRTRFARRSAVIAVAVVLFIIAPLTALAVRVVFNSPPPVPHPLMLSGPLSISLKPRWTAAGSSMSLAIAGRLRRGQVGVVADFAIPHRAFNLAVDPITPPLTPPPGHVLIAFRHFPATGQARLWQEVDRLQLPANFHGQRRLTLDLRLSTEAVKVEIRFGSTPTPAMRATADAMLGAIHHN